MERMIESDDGSDLNGIDNDPEFMDDEDSDLDGIDNDYKIRRMVNAKRQCKRAYGGDRNRKHRHRNAA